MAFLSTPNVTIKGLSACVPQTEDKIHSIYKWEGMGNFMQSTGIQARRRSDVSTTSADLCATAAEKLISELGWTRSQIEVLVFVSQTPDYILPATSAVLQNRLGLSTDCYALDISLGCSGWVYALSVIASLMQNGSIRKGLLLAGDTILKSCSPEDKSTYPLFGDAGTATALEWAPDAAPIHYVFNTDGDGYDTIIIDEGGFRNPITTRSFEAVENSEGIRRNGIQLKLDGMNVFSFGITKAPKSVKQLIEHFEINKERVDLFTFHQANKLMNEKIRRKLGLSEEKVPYCMDEFANTSCASIPLTLVTRERSKLENECLKHIVCGFGVGLSWGSAYFETDKIRVPELIEI